MTSQTVVQNKINVCSAENVVLSVILCKASEFGAFEIIDNEFEGMCKLNAREVKNALYNLQVGGIIIYRYKDKIAKASLNMIIQIQLLYRIKEVH